MGKWHGNLTRFALTRQLRAATQEARSMAVDQQERSLLSECRFPNEIELKAFRLPVGHARAYLSIQGMTLRLPHAGQIRYRRQRPPAAARHYPRSTRLALKLRCYV